MNELTQALHVAAEVTATIAAAAVAAHPRETGGLLLGWWDSGRVIVRHAVEVLDPNATETSWVRDHHTAQIALRDALGDHGHPWLGYVGDWHSHPVACGASGHDITSIQRASGQYEQPLVLLVHQVDSRIEAVVTKSDTHPLLHGLVPTTPERQTS
jgi:proteasome lid subunit RPN8/RPN11